MPNNPSNVLVWCEEIYISVIARCPREFGAVIPFTIRQSRFTACEIFAHHEHDLVVWLDRSSQRPTITWEFDPFVLFQPLTLISCLSDGPLLGIGRTASWSTRQGQPPYGPSITLTLILTKCDVVSGCLHQSSESRGPKPVCSLINLLWGALRIVEARKPCIVGIKGGARRVRNWQLQKWWAMAGPLWTTWLATMKYTFLMSCMPFILRGLFAFIRVTTFLLIDWHGGHHFWVGGNKFSTHSQKSEGLKARHYCRIRHGQ